VKHNSGKKYYFSDYLREDFSSNSSDAWSCLLVVPPLLLLFGLSNSTAWIVMVSLEVVILCLLYLHYRIKKLKRRIGSYKNKF
jgi:hypothetical protein